MSVVLFGRQAAQEFYDDVAGNGERVCMSALGTGTTGKFTGERFWLFSC